MQEFQIVDKAIEEALKEGCITQTEYDVWQTWKTLKSTALTQQTINMETIRNFFNVVVAQLTNNSTNALEHLCMSCVQVCPLRFISSRVEFVVTKCESFRRV